MGKRLSIAQPAVIQTELRPLDESFWINSNNQLEQWYYQNTGVFAPDRQVTPLTLTPQMTAKDADNPSVEYSSLAGATYPLTFQTVTWKVKEWNGTTWVESTITSLTPSDYYHLSGNSLVVAKNNYDAIHAVNITCTAVYQDPRDVGVLRTVQESVMLITSVDATQVYPDIDILNPSARMFNPLKDNPIFEFEGTADWSGIEGQGGTAITEYKVDPLGTEEILPTNDEMVINAAPLLDVKYGDTYITDAQGNHVPQQFMERQVSGGLVNPISDGIAKIENIKGNTVKVVQLADLNWTGTAGTTTVNGTSFTITITEGSYAEQACINGVIINGHKYYVKANVTALSGTAARISQSDDYSFINNITSTGVYSSVKIATANTTLRIVVGGSANNSATFKNLIFLDLTAMGIDNLTTVAEVEAWLESHLGNLDYIPYTAGKLVNYGGYSVKWNQLDKGNVVDMGLPSGTLWSIANLDATTQSGFAEVDGKPSPFIYECTFFSWGNTEGHNPISESAFDYDWGSSNSGPYASTPGATLTANAGLSFDAARAILGAPWRDPSTEDFAELFDNTDYVDANGDVISGTNKLTTINSITGIYLKSKINGKLLFFPCSGDGYGQSWNYRGSYGVYWSRSLLSQTHGRNLNFSSGGVYPQYDNYRFYGLARRAVTTPISTDDGYHKYFSKDKTIIDLTLMFGAGNEPDLEWCNKWLSRDYYEYCPSLDRNILDVMEEKTTIDGVDQYSHPAMGMKTVGFNQWDEEWEIGYIRPEDGIELNYNDRIRMKNYMPILPSTTYYKKTPAAFWCVYFDSHKNYIGYADGNANTTFTTPSNAYFMRCGFEAGYGTTYAHDICVNLSDPAKNGQYEPYWSSFSDMSWIRKIGIENFNIWDEEWEEGSFVEGSLNSKNFISVSPSTTYYFNTPLGNVIFYYDANHNKISTGEAFNTTFTTPVNCAFIKFRISTDYGTTYNHDICINKSIPAYNGKYLPHGMTMPYFPNGLCKAGSVFDEVKVEGGKIKGVVRFGGVDLGDLNYVYGSSLAIFYSSQLNSIAKNGYAVASKCSKYANSGSGVQIADKTYVLKSSYYGSSMGLVIKDSSYTDAETFKSSVTGEKLVFELETPYEFEIDYPTKGQFEWYGVNGSGQETPIDQLPVYTQATQPSGYGQGTSRININALYGENIPVILRVKRYPWSDGVLPPRVTKSVAWRVPSLDVIVVSDMGNAVRAQNMESNFTFSTIVNMQDDVISDDVKQDNMVFDWYYVKYGTDGSAQTPVSCGSGLTKSIAASILKNTTPQSGSTPSTNVYCEAYVLGAYHLVNGVYVRTKE